MKEFIVLLTAIVGLATALISLNATGVIDLPGGENRSPSNGVTGSVSVVVPPAAAKVEVPELRGLALQDAEAKLAAEGLGVRSVERIAPCDYESGMVEQTGPPTGWELTKGDKVILFVCE